MENFLLVSLSNAIAKMQLWLWILNVFTGKGAARGGAILSRRMAVSNTMTSGRSAYSQTHTGFLRMCIDDFCYNSPTPMELPPLSRICSKGPKDS
jgi:hypothetical protein